MANCDLSIELEQSEKIYHERDTVRGIVRVQADKNVNCSELEVRTRWTTHGRGNVDSGVVDTKNLFSGQWVAGEQREYRFELAVAAWPPTYHGHYLNVDHYVEARAKIPWGFDPKAAAAFQVQPSRCPEELASKTRPGELAGGIRAVITLSVVGVLTFIGFGIGFAGGWAALAIMMFVVIPGAIYLVGRFVLPRWLLGDVRYTFDGTGVAPGQQIVGELVVQPKKHVSINAISLHLLALERCISGSGSNRTTHKHELLSVTNIIQDSTTLRSNQEHHFPLVVRLPEDAPYSLDLRDNDLVWSATVRIDIPRWPDWRAILPIEVVPAEGARRDQAAATAVDQLGSVPATHDPRVVDPPAATGEGEITFAETVGHLWKLRENPQQIAVLADAVTGLSFDIQARIERRLLYTGTDDPQVYQGGHAIWAHYPNPKLPMVLYAPREMGDDFEQVGSEPWQGRGTILGWDDRQGRLKVKLEPS